MTFGGSPALSLRLTGSDGHWLDLVSHLAEGAGTGLLLGFRTSLKASLPWAPVELDIGGLGFDLPLALELGTPLLPDPARLLPPSRRRSVPRWTSRCSPAPASWRSWAPTSSEGSR